MKKEILLECRFQLSDNAKSKWIQRRQLILIDEYKRFIEELENELYSELYVLK